MENEIISTLEEREGIDRFIERIAFALERIAAAAGPYEPNIQRELSEYTTFDWNSIGAEIVSKDADGPTRVRKDGYIWIRRAPENKFEPAIWFSRTEGKDEAGDANYLKLITFRTWPDPEPISAKVKAALNAKGNGHQETRRPVQESPDRNQPIRNQVQRAPEPESKPAGSGLLSTQDYYAQAKAKGVPTDQAAMIAKFAGVNFNGPTNKMNFAKAVPVLEFVSVALASTGLTFPAILDTIKRSGSLEIAAQELGITPA